MEEEQEELTERKVALGAFGSVDRDYVAWRYAQTPDPLAVTGEFNMPPGLYIMHGPRASGKSINCLALALACRKAKRGLVDYQYILEPRAVGSRAFFTQGYASKWLEYACTRATGGLLCVDSVTLLASLLDSHVLFANRGNVAYKGGVTRGDHLAFAEMDLTARESGVALVATVNSELFPIAELFEGAAEGEIRCNGAGNITLRSRLDRQQRTFNLDTRAAGRKLFPKSERSASTPAPLSFSTIDIDNIEDVQGT